MKCLKLLLVAALLAAPRLAVAHHGGASTSQGPGTPIETNSPLTLPAGKTVVYTRGEYVKWRKFENSQPYNTNNFAFGQLGASYGLTDFLTGTLILPYNSKTQDVLGTADGFGDVKLLLNLGLNFDDEGVHLNANDDTAVNLGESDKGYFGFYGGVSFPTGRTDIDLGQGIDAGLQPGFGSPSFTLGGSYTQALSEGFTFCADTGVDLFTSRDGARFGTEWRVNLAGVAELYADPNSTIRRMDGVLELNYLHIGRDIAPEGPEEASGGRILYLSPGARFQVGDVNLGVLLKVPVMQALHESSQQQGAEGLEQFRVIFTASTYF